MAYTSWSVAQSEQPTTTKWNLLNSNDAYFYSVLGDSLQWTSFTPQFDGLTPGNGTNTGKYARVGKMVAVQTYFAYGSASSNDGGDFVLYLPVSEASYYNSGGTPTLGQAIKYDSATSSAIEGAVVFFDTGQVFSLVYGTAAASATMLSISGSIPSAWVATDELHMSFIYEAA